MVEKIRLKVSAFVADILENDALRFGFVKNGQSNKNALLNKLIPTLVAVRKARRNEIEHILKDEYNREDANNIYNAVNTVIDRVYFNGEELDELIEYIWIRPTKEKRLVFDEITSSEIYITAQETNVYIRSLLNEYARLPQYKREALVFDEELDIFADACYSRQIVHFQDKVTNTSYKAYAFHYHLGYLYDQTNYCIIYDINRQLVKSIPLHRIKDIYLIKQKYKPGESLLSSLQEYTAACNFEQILIVGDK